MPVRVTNYWQAFEVVIGVKYDDKLKSFIKNLELEGHTEKSICYAIFKTQEKLAVYKDDSRFLSILKNEILKYSWPKGDPRWDEYWKRKNETERAEKIRKELQKIRQDESAISKLEADSKKPSKGISRSRGFVYFIQGLCGGAIKIGYSVNPTMRLKELQTGYPDTLTILLLIPGSEATEAAIHRELEGSRLRGEWFRPDQVVIDKIKELTEKFNEPEVVTERLSRNSNIKHRGKPAKRRRKTG
jgi:hypothetical protein